MGLGEQIAYDLLIRDSPSLKARQACFSHAGPRGLAARRLPGRRPLPRNLAALRLTGSARGGWDPRAPVRSCQRGGPTISFEKRQKRFATSWRLDSKHGLLAAPCGVGVVAPGTIANLTSPETDMLSVTFTVSTTYIKRRARDSNPDVLADAGFQVG